MPVRRRSMLGYTAAIRARELGQSHYPMPSLGTYFGGLRTTPDDEFGFWDVTPAGSPVAVPPFTIAFSKTALHGHALLAGDEEGVITILNTTKSLRSQMHAMTPDTRPFARFRGHDNAIFDAVWIPGDDDIATAGGDGTIRVFDASTYLRKALLRGASGSVKCVRPLPGNSSVLVSAARDGDVRFYDIRLPAVYDTSVAREMFHRPVAIIEQAHARPPPRVEPSQKRRRIRADVPGSRVGSVTSLAFLPGRENILFTAGAADGTVRLWDIRAGTKNGTKMRWAGCVALATPGLEERDDSPGRRRTHGIASLDIDAGGRSLIASSTDSTIFVYDACDLQLGHSQVLTGHTQTSFYIRAKLSPCGRYVASGSADSKAYIWDLQTGANGLVQPMLELDGHRGGEAAGVDWCQADRFKLATCADDSTAKLWRVQPGQKAGKSRLEEGTDRDEDDIFNGARHVVRRERPRNDKQFARVTGRDRSPRKLKNADIRSFFRSEPVGRAGQ